MRDIVALIRVHHYVKNLLVFTSLLCSGQIFNLFKVREACIAFLAFSMIASIVYVINDLKDVDKDKAHPLKCKRPFASGRVSERTGYVVIIVLLFLATIFNYIVFNVYSTILLGAYLIINIMYSFGLKNIPIVDVTILVSGFLIRILYGAVINDISISNWLYLTVLMASYYLAFGKRRNELTCNTKKDTRNVLRFYNISFLDKNMYVCLGLTNCFYALWAMDKGTVDVGNGKYLVLTVPIVLILFMRYSLVIEGKSDGDPVEVLSRDKFLLSLSVFYLMIMMFLICI